MRYLLLLDRFNEVQERTEVGTWYRFLCNLPERVVVLLTSLANPATVAVWEGASCYWHEYRVDKMTSEDLFRLFTELAAVSGIDQRIHLYDPKQQKTLHEICTLLDGYPLGAELIFGTAQLIDGKVYQPEAATRSLEEVLEELHKTHLEGIWAVLDVVFRRLSEPARLLLPYLAVFKLPFSHAQIAMLVEPGLPAAERAVERLEPAHAHEEHASAAPEGVHPTGASIPAQLLTHWSSARDELVQASFVQFDGRMYGIHAQVRKFALSHLPEDEHRRVLRVAAAYYSSLAHPSPEQWFAAFENLLEAGEPQDLEKAIHLAISAAQALHGRGHATGLRDVLHRAEVYAIRLGEKTCEARIQYWLGTILRQQGDYAEAIACLMRSFSLHNELNNRDEAAWALHELAMLLREEGDLEQADQRAHEALELFRNAGDTKGEAWMQMALGEVSRGYGRYDEARGHFERALTSFRTLPDAQDQDEGCALALRDRGIVYEAQGNYEAALEDYEAALRLFTALEMPYWQAWVLVNRSEVYVDQGRYEEAEKACQEAMTIFRQEGGRRGQGWCWRVLGDIARKQRNFGDARNFYEEALSAFNVLTDVVDQARVYNSLGAIAFEERAFPVAKDYYEHAQALAHRQGVRQIEGRALRGLGDVARELHAFDEAQQQYQKALAIAQDLDIPAERCAVKRHLGELYMKQDKHPAALEVWMQALSLDERLGHPERKYLQEKVVALVEDHHLEEEYRNFCKQYGLNNA
jgi:tetratricopeptide (TPR) repeat protein